MLRFAIAIVSVSLLLACGKTEKDEEYSQLIIGNWFSVSQSDTTFYTFEKNSTGTSERFGNKDKLSWEIRRGFLRTYYSKAPKYLIGEDKYNSKGVYRILSLSETKGDFEQHIYGGYVTLVTLHKH